MTFLGFNIDRRTGNLIDLQTRTVLEEGIMQQNLFDALIRNRVNLAENFDALPRFVNFVYCKSTLYTNTGCLEVLSSSNLAYAVKGNSFFSVRMDF